ncbi:MAG: acetate kinase [Candidatus Omnitrophota bacterium]
MEVLVINCGSSSIKYQLFRMPEEVVLAKGLVDKIGKEDGELIHSVKGEDYKIKEAAKDHTAGLKLILNTLVDEKVGVLKSISEIKAVGHRVVHGGESFSGSMLITPEVVKAIKDYFDLAPLHNPPNLSGIEAAMTQLPGIANIACFDTAFHQTIPQVAYLYALPYELYEKYKVRRYGFHGTSHRYVARRYAELTGKHKYGANCITIHLGNGCSIAAVKEGKSVDTSMGLTPLEGLVMGTRCGDIDPAIIFYLSDKNMSVADINQMLNKKSGLLGVSGTSNDVRDLIDKSRKGDKQAQLALDIFAYRVKKYIGSYLAVLGKCDSIIFTGGIGENAVSVRENICAGLEELGIKIDKEKNVKMVGRKEGSISENGSKIEVYVVPTNEEIGIARDTYQLLTEKASAK